MKQATVNRRWTLILPDQIADWDAITGWERTRLRSMEDHLRQGMVLFDVGAEHGWLAAIYASFVGPENMVLIEPDPAFWANIRLIWQENHLADPMFTVQALLSDSGEIVPGEVWPDCTADEEHRSGGYRYLHEPKHRAETPISTIDLLAQVATPAAITIDVEGAELVVLRGAQATLEQHRPIVWVSVHPDLMARDYDSSPDEVHEFMRDAGYSNQHLGTDHEEHWLYQPSRRLAH